MTALTRDFLINLGESLWDQLGEVKNVSTTTLAETLFPAFPDMPQKDIFKALQKLGESGYPGATRGPVKDMYGQPRRPWLWGHNMDRSALDTWAQTMQPGVKAETWAVGTERRMEQIEKRLEKLEALAYPS